MEKTEMLTTDREGGAVIQGVLRSTETPKQAIVEPQDDTPFATRGELGEFISRTIRSELSKTRIDLPYVQSDQTPMSRGFSLLRIIGVLSGQLEQSKAKYEMDVSGRLGNALLQRGFLPTEGRTFVLPLCTSYLPDDLPELRRELHEAWTTGAGEPDEANWIRRQIPHYRALSSQDGLTGGVLIPFPQQAELIDLLRAKSAIIELATQIPLPPGGRLRWPKMTGAGTAYWVGENVAITLSQQATGWVDLIVKKVAARVQVPNELFRFSSPAADNIVRGDVAKVLALKADSAYLEGTGGSQPKGVINYDKSAADTTTAGVVQLLAAGVTGTNGDTLQFEDSEKAIAAVEEALGNEVTAFIMRPKMHRLVRTRRADAVTAADAKGAFLAIWDRLQAVRETWNGIPVRKSTQITNNRTKGTGTTLTYVLAGHWASCVLAFGGALEISQNPWETTAWANDLTEIRAIMHTDSALLYPEDFALIDTLLVS